MTNLLHARPLGPQIYKRFMEKEAREWRQIYKVRCSPEDCAAGALCRVSSPTS